MPTTVEPHPAHIVVAGYDDNETSAVGGALARRLHHPFLDGTATPEAAVARSHDGSAVQDAVIAWFDQKVKTDGHAVIAVQAAVLERPAADHNTDTWTVWLDDPTSAHNLVTVGDDDAARRANVRRQCDVRVDTTGHDVDRIVEQLEVEWKRIPRSQRKEQHHVW